MHLKDRAQQELGDELPGITLDQIGNNLVYGNDGGHGLLSEIKEMRNDIALLLAKDKTREDTLKEHRQEIQDLKHQTKTLRQVSEGYLAIRRRFIDVYKRDVRSSIRGSKAIQIGNSLAHEGDVVVDAYLYTRDHRTDESVFCELYGLGVNQVLVARMYCS